MTTPTGTKPSKLFLVQVALTLVVVGGMTALLWPSPKLPPVALITPAPAFDETPGADAGVQTAVFAGGCFWGVQGVFQRVRGVQRAVSGYAGGDAGSAHYEIVGGGQTGHAEVVEIRYDPKQVSYGQLLQIYFSVVADPTLKDRQGPDRGTQYRSAIFTRDASQQQIAERYIAQLSGAGVFSRPIVTTMEPLQAFYPAEDYHQDFLLQHPTYPYIAINDIPKVDALKERFPDRYMERPALTGTAGGG